MKMKKASINYIVDIIIAVALIISAISGIVLLLNPTGQGFGGGRGYFAAGVRGNVSDIHIWKDIHTVFSIILAAGALLGAAVLATAHREGVAATTAAWLLAAAGAAWLLVAGPATVRDVSRAAELAEESQRILARLEADAARYVRRRLAGCRAEHHRQGADQQLVPRRAPRLRG